MIYQISSNDYPENKEYYGFVEGEGDLAILYQEFKSKYRVKVLDGYRVGWRNMDRLISLQFKLKKRSMRLLKLDGIQIEALDSINKAFIKWLVQFKDFKKVEVQSFLVERED